MSEETKITSAHWQLHRAQKKTAQHYKNKKKTNKHTTKCINTLL